MSVSLFDRAAYAVAVAFVVLVLGTRLTGSGGPESDTLSARIQRWTDSQMVLRGVSTPGVSAARMEACVRELKARPDVSDALWRLDSPPWSGDEALALDWGSLWGERAVAEIEVRPNWNSLQRTFRAVEMWREAIVAHDALADVRLSTVSLEPLDAVTRFETSRLALLTRLWWLLVCSTLLAWGVALSRRLRPPLDATESAGLGFPPSRGARFTPLVLECGAALIVFIFLRVIFFAGLGGDGYTLGFSGSAILFLAGSYGIVAARDWTSSPVVATREPTDEPGESWGTRE